MKILDRLLNWDSNVELICVLGGLGVFSYLGTSWVLSLWSQGSYAASIGLVLAGIVLAGSALMRIPLALVLVFGGAAVAAAAFLSGHLALFLP